MNARPILFSAPMVRALLAGTKTQTRRIVKPQPNLAAVHEPVRPEPRGNGCWIFMVHTDRPHYQFATGGVRCPYGSPGDLLWVRETWARYKINQDSCEIAYRATPAPDWPEGGNWRPSIFMPRQRSRITLRITDLRVQRLQETNEADAIAEGAEPLLVAPDGGSSPHVEGYRRLWDSINGAGAWDADPFVWALTFEVLQKNVDEVLQAAAKHKEQA